MKINIRHTTRHRYERPVSFSEHALYLRPVDSHLRRVESFELKTVPESRQRWVRDAHGNIVLHANFGLNESDRLEFDTAILVDVAEDNPFDFILEPYATGFPFRYTDTDQRALAAFLTPGAPKGEITVLDWFYGAVPEPNKHSDVVQFLSDINSAIRETVGYERRDEEGIQPPDTTLRLRSGSCRDMAVLFISACRQLGLAARFASGYLFDPPAEDGGHTFNRAVGSMHAWAEVYLPGAGWKGFDPTNGILANSFFIPSAVSHDPACVDPIQGKYFSKEKTASVLEVDLSMTEVGV